MHAWFKLLTKHFAARTPGPTTASNLEPGQSPERAATSWDDSISVAHVMEVAQGLRYRSLDQLIGTGFAVQSAQSADQDFKQAIGDCLRPAANQERWLPLGAGTHRAYGFLRLALPARPELLLPGALQGIPLLETLGFLSREESGPCLYPQDFEVLLPDVRNPQAILCLLAQDEGWRVSARAWWREGAGASPPQYEPVFPLRFKIIDACISNSSHVWRWKHFYW